MNQVAAVFWCFLLFSQTFFFFSEVLFVIVFSLPLLLLLSLVHFTSSYYRAISRSRLHFAMYCTINMYISTTFFPIWWCSCCVPISALLSLYVEVVRFGTRINKRIVLEMHFSYLVHVYVRERERECVCYHERLRVQPACKFVFASKLIEDLPKCDKAKTAFTSLAQTNRKKKEENSWIMM